MKEPSSASEEDSASESPSDRDGDGNSDSDNDSDANDKPTNSAARMRADKDTSDSADDGSDDGARPSGDKVAAEWDALRFEMLRLVTARSAPTDYESEDGTARSSTMGVSTAVSRLTMPPRKPHKGVVTTPMVFADQLTTVYQAIVDTGANRNFVDPTIPATLEIKVQHLERSRRVFLADNCTVSVGSYIEATIVLGQGFPAYEGRFYVFPLGTPPMVLGLPFCQAADPMFDWEERSIQPRPSEWSS